MYVYSVEVAEITGHLGPGVFLAIPERCHAFLDRIGFDEYQASLEGQE